MRMGYSALLLVLSLLTATWSAEIYVDDNAPGDPLPFDRQIGDPHEDGSAAHPFDSIQEAINAAMDGDTIIVAPGHYLSPNPYVYDEISFKGKNIRLVGSAPTDFSVANQTILCGVVIFQGDEDPNCLLQGFKIQSLGHGGILGNGTKASVSRCIISGNGPCSATVVKDVCGRIANCLIVDNTTVYYCGVMPAISGCPEIVNCTIANNVSGVGIALDRTGIMQNCIIHGNGGSQILLPAGPSPRSTAWQLKYCLVQGWADSEIDGAIYTAGNFDSDPCFVQPGYWERGVLVEGDYHLKSRGYRWTEEEIHGSHWYFDLVTSCAIDAGNPMSGLQEEPERGPDDPEGRWAVNHAIDCGAYGGTAQASLAPNNDRPPGIGTVDLRDYLPLASSSSWSTTKAGQTFQGLSVTSVTQVNGYEVHILRDTSPLWWRTAACVYINFTFYSIQNPVTLNWLPDTKLLEAKYPQYLVVGSTIQAPDDPFAKATTPGKPALVVRGSLSDVLAGTKFDPSQFAARDGGWLDVIAIRERTADGAAGEPITLFARGFGPLLLSGLPVTSARIGDIRYVVGSGESAPTSGSGTTKRR